MDKLAFDDLMEAQKELWLAGRIKSVNLTRPE